MTATYVSVKSTNHGYSIHKFATRMSSPPAPLPTNTSVALSGLPESLSWTASTLDRQGQQALYLVYSVSESAAKDLVQHLWLGLYNL